MKCNTAIRRLVPGSKLLQDFQLHMPYNNADCLFICHSLLQDSQPLALSQWQKSSSFGRAVSPNTALDNQENHYSSFSPLILSHFSLRSYPICNFSKSLPALKCGLHSIRYNLNFISQCPVLIKLYFWIIWKMNMGTVNKIITNHDYNNALNTRHEMWIWEVKQCHHKNAAAWKLNKWFLYRIPVRTGRKMKSKQNKR